MTYPTSTCTSANDQSHVIESGFERTNPPLHDDQVFNTKSGRGTNCLRAFSLQVVVCREHEGEVKGC